MQGKGPPPFTLHPNETSVKKTPPPFKASASLVLKEDEVLIASQLSEPSASLPGESEIRPKGKAPPPFKPSASFSVAVDPVGSELTQSEFLPLSSSVKKAPPPFKPASQSSTINTPAERPSPPFMPSSGSAEVKKAPPPFAKASAVNSSPELVVRKAPPPFAKAVEGSPEQVYRKAPPPFSKDIIKGGDAALTDDISTPTFGNMASDEVQTRNAPPPFGGKPAKAPPPFKQPESALPETLPKKAPPPFKPGQVSSNDSTQETPKKGPPPFKSPTVSEPPRKGPPPFNASAPQESAKRTPPPFSQSMNGSQMLSKLAPDTAEFTTLPDLAQENPKKGPPPFKAPTISEPPRKGPPAFNPSTASQPVRKAPPPFSQSMSGPDMLNRLTPETDARKAPPPFVAIETEEYTAHRKPNASHAVPPAFNSLSPIEVKSKPPPFKPKQTTEPDTPEFGTSDQRLRSHTNIAETSEEQKDAPGAFKDRSATSFSRSKSYLDAQALLGGEYHNARRQVMKMTPAFKLTDYTFTGDIETSREVFPRPTNFSFPSMPMRHNKSIKEITYVSAASSISPTLAAKVSMIECSSTVNENRSVSEEELKRALCNLSFLRD